MRFPRKPPGCCGASGTSRGHPVLERDDATGEAGRQAMWRWGSSERVFCRPIWCTCWVSHLRGLRSTFSSLPFRLAFIQVASRLRSFSMLCRTRSSFLALDRLRRPAWHRKLPDLRAVRRPSLRERFRFRRTLGPWSGAVAEEA